MESFKFMKLVLLVLVMVMVAITAPAIACQSCGAVVKGTSLDIVSILSADINIVEYQRLNKDSVIIVSILNGRDTGDPIFVAELLLDCKETSIHRPKGDGKRNILVFQGSYIGGGNQRLSAFG